MLLHEFNWKKEVIQASERARQRCKVGSLTPSFWQTWAMLKPWARSASAWRTLGMTCAGACRVMFVSFAPVGPQRLSYHLDQFLGSTPLSGSQKLAADSTPHGDIP